MSFLLEAHFEPQAVISGDVKQLAKRLSFELEEHTDDFDQYVGAGLRYDKTPVALMRYAGHPPNQYTLYLPHGSGNVTELTALIHNIVQSLKVPENTILWERKDTPEL